MHKIFRIKNYIYHAFFFTLICFGIGTLIYLYVGAALMHNTEESLKEIAKQGAKTVEQEIFGHLDVLKTLAMMDQVKDPHISWVEKFKILDTEVVRSRHRRMGLIDPGGYSRTSDNRSAYLGDREYFRAALTGKANVSNPTISRFDGMMSVVLAVPIVNNGQITSVLTATDDIDVLCKITDNIKLGENGSSFIINQRGEFIAHSD